jgi:transposase-like protein
MSLPDPLKLARVINPPKSLREFTRRFRTEADCEDFLFRVRYPEGFVCPNCDVRQGWALNGKRLTECSSGHKISLTAGTAFHGTRQDLLTWLHAVFLISTLTPGISALQFQRQMGLKRYETAFQMLHTVRSMLVAPGRELLHREVEVDETLIGGKDLYRGGRSGDKALVVGAVEIIPFSKLKTGKVHHRSGRVRLQVVADASANSLAGFVEAEVEPGATVNTDGWDGYRRLNHSGYHHQRYVQGRNRELKPILPHIHRVFSNLKAWLQGTHHGRIEQKYLQAYLNEYTFRFNRRFWPGPAFLRALTFMLQPKHKM